MHWIYAHFIGDYLLQNDWMALGKKSSTGTCLIHVSAYILPFAFCGLHPWQIAIVAIQHFIQDRTGFVVWLMKAKGSGQFATGPCAPWSIIVTDNILHILTIAAVTSFQI